MVWSRVKELWKFFWKVVHSQEAKDRRAAWFAILSVVSFVTSLFCSFGWSLILGIVAGFLISSFVDYANEKTDN
ncbi:hypothetical protein D3C74_48900 [compost metagenome]